ncbi:hypothetical protein VitviT2T_029244 [Vitis vinifera]|uniref:TIR domain-containing protein n=1 Tax=Vitis vinifera TaxID=29760 RepID=A0ABY9DXD5_VITVI|nr:hypothetical protein VitviT2T_029244 [Vitis vinifera]
MASSSTLKASSSTSNCDGYNYHVFLSFRGEDTRQTFTGHLYANLVARGIHTFRDDEELEKGGDIASDLSRAIEESKIFIIIFSKHYADSKWCLNELVKIIDCMTEKKSVVLPVFYHVEPTDVRNQGGSFKDAFLEHAKDADQEKKKKIETWKNALKIAANLSGFHLQNQSEAEFIQRIYEDIAIRLNRTPLDMGYNIVGMDFHLTQLKSLIKVELDEVLMVGIYGIGGIGKTTISKAIYNDISSQFDGCSFLGNVGGKCEDGLLKLQKTLLQDIVKCKVPKFNNISQGINVIKERLRSKRVLIVLDDVDNYMQLENLAGKHGWYGAKSIIIITTKDKHLLDQHEVKALYEVQKLNHEKSVELFNWWAFKQNTPKTGFESLSNSVVEYTHGLPVALKVLGGFLYEKSINEWESELHKVKKIPDEIVQNVLKVSYDKLDHTCQEIFLDIACFFRGKDKDFVSRILGSYAMMGIKVLNDKCLLTISENKLDMHDLVQQMGQEIVRQECLKEPGNRSRLWDCNDVDSVLTRNTGTQAIEGLFVQGSLASQISTNSFTKLNRLRLLKVYYPHMWKKDFKALKNLDFPYFELRYFHFKGYPLESLPTNFHAKNLVELNLKHSSIKQLWQGNEILDNLKVINLSYSEKLVEISDFSRVTNLEILILKGCRSLESLPRNFHKLERLQSLSCKDCLKMKSFPAIKGNMSKLREIDLTATSIKELPSSIAYLKALQHLDLSWCKSLRSLSESICNLSSLKTLILEGCSNLKGFPEINDDMENLKMLDLSRTGIKELPSSIGHLKALKHLNLLSCGNLAKLPESICNLRSLETLILEGCSNLEGFPKINDDMENLKRLNLKETCIEKLPSSIGHLKALKHLDLFSCKSLRSLSESICNLSSLETLILEGCSNLKGFPEIKDDMENLKRLDLSFTGIEELPSSIGRLKALKHLNLKCCAELVSLPDSICRALKKLDVQKCPKLERVEVNLVGSLDLTCCILKQRVIWWSNNLLQNEVEGEVLNHYVLSLSSLVESCSRDYRGFHLSALEVLSVGNFSPIQRRILSDIFRQSSLKSVCLRNCNLMEEGVPSDIWNLSSLVNLSLSNCSLTEGEILNHICHVSSLQNLSLDGNHFSSIPANIIQLSKLRTLGLYHCQKLLQIPELPPSLRALDVHDCPCLETLSSLSSLLGFSLFKCFESTIEV